MLFRQPILECNLTASRKGHQNIPETSLVFVCQLRFGIFMTQKNLAVKITDFCLPSEKLIKCLC